MANGAISGTLHGKSTARQTVARRRPSPTALVHENGGRFASMLGIDVAAGRGERFKWFLAALLYGAPIPEPLATRTWRQFASHNVLTPQRIIDTGWDGLVTILDAGGYVRYDFKTATKLLDVCGALLRDYSGNVDAVHSAASGPHDLEARLKALGKGVGDTTVAIFLRELLGIWDKAAPPLSPLALAAGQELGYLRRGSLRAETALERLRQEWTDDGQPASTFADFESALVRVGLHLRRGVTRQARTELIDRGRAKHP